MKQNSRTACMLLFGATLFLAACQNEVAQELADNKQPVYMQGRNSNGDDISQNITQHYRYVPVFQQQLFSFLQ